MYVLQKLWDRLALVATTTQLYSVLLRERGKCRTKGAYKTDERWNKRHLSALNRSSVFLGLMVSLWLCMGCAKYPAASTRESQDFIKQVYTACNTKNVERLRDCEAKLAELKSSGRVSETEHTAFAQIIEAAKKDDWQSAQAQALRFAKDQVR